MDELCPAGRVGAEPFVVERFALEDRGEDGFSDGTCVDDGFTAGPAADGFEEGDFADGGFGLEGLALDGVEALDSAFLRSVCTSPGSSTR